MTKRCTMCRERDADERVALKWCRVCGDAYERWNRTAECTHAALIAWVQRRVWYFANRRGTAAKGGSR